MGHLITEIGKKVNGIPIDEEKKPVNDFLRDPEKEVLLIINILVMDHEQF